MDASDFEEKNENESQVRRYIKEVTHEFLSQLQKYSGEVKQKLVGTLLKHFHDIIKHPYLDRYRILTLDSVFANGILKQTFIVQFLKRIGFIEDFSDKQQQLQQQQLFYYPYTATIHPLTVAQSILKESLTGLADDNDKVDINKQTNFETFSKFVNILSQDLLRKEAKPERIIINLNLDEVRMLHAQLKMRNLQDLLLLFNKDSPLVETTIQDVVTSKRRMEAVLCKRNF